MTGRARRHEARTRSERARAVQAEILGVPLGGAHRRLREAGLMQVRELENMCLKYMMGRQSATLMFNKAAANNTIDLEMLDAMQDAIMDLQDRPQVRVVVIKSEGKFFSNGFDPKYLMSESNMTDQQIAAAQMQFAKILYHLQALPQLT
eukprot:CAMPEP_0170203894 /NCGR_PEP_ID=MMETSP0116_2-20130129/1462_1 /TAXON_ID=400756 /ORGANISM="Durinskia baltica, Strain CSIRO CS-38" /LENGTH=148 /DNA_ID=CAMNT_0010454227 /DNA_START=46 /DNA_END=489 /DNA_ORIENTATION=+